MQHILTPSYILTNEHAASSYGVPVLLHRQTGHVYGPADIAVFYPSHGYDSAADFTLRALKTNPAAKEAVRAFCASFPNGPQVTD
jgi:hypothetical protein